MIPSIQTFNWSRASSSPLATVTAFAVCLATLLPFTTANCDINSVLGTAGLEVYVNGDVGYDDAAFQWASLIIDYADTVSPTMIAFAQTVSDVQLVVDFVNNCDDIDTITIRSGGHQYSGTSSCDTGRCLQLDLSQLDTFETLEPVYVDPDDTTGYSAALIKLGPGWSLFDLYPVAAAQGYVILSGICEDVHIGGNYQSSAHGFYTHSLGSGMDYIVEMEVVLADGSLITVSETNNYANLFFALRGGSPGAFGVVVSYSVKVYYTTNFPNAYMSYTFYRFGNTAEDEEVLTTLSQLYTEATASDAFANSLDIGAIYGVLLPRQDAGSGALGQALDFFGSSHVVYFLIVYLGRESNTPFLDSDVYTDIVQGLFRNVTRLVQAPLTVSDFPVPASSIPVIGAVPWVYVPSGHTSIFSNQFFNDGVHETVAYELTALINDEGYDVLMAFQGGAYGGQFLTNDPNREFTAHPYRDTIAFFDIWLRLRNTSVPLANDGAQELQEVLNVVNDIIKENIPVGDRNKIWIPYSNGADVDIENVWPNYYENDEDFYNDLRCTKYLVDPNDLFKSSLTVTPRECDTFEPTEEPTQPPTGET